ncbi:MAG TPA: tripartite tricarboxylate transporter substrate binding protein [Ramlibacter sp.]|nr:tripartite tricarboxylate transporter substrate binding protein [Ramlibacter sp.]
MNASRRTVLGASTLFAAGLAVPGLVRAQDGTAHLYVGFPPGGSGDLFARILADGLREELKRTVVVENRPGGGGMTVAQQFLRLPKDGNHIMLATGSTAIAAPVSRAKAPYNPVEDFQWIALLSNAPFVIAVNPALPVKNLRELVAYAKDRPGKLSYGHAGLGTTVHLAGEMFKDRAGVNVVDVPYAGSGPAINDTIGGTVQMVIEAAGTLIQHHRAGKLRIVTLMSETRDKLLPDVQTSREEGVDLISGTCNLLAVPQGTPAAATDVLAKATARVLDKPATLERLAALGITPITNSSPADARAFVTTEVARWGALAKKLNIAL